MGDLVERIRIIIFSYGLVLILHGSLILFRDITTVPKQEKIFYKITSGSLRFQVKGPCNAGIGLARSTRETDCLWFVLGADGCTKVEKNQRPCKSVLTPNILSVREFREFWIQWHNNIISLGSDYVPDPIIVHQDKTNDLKYITFAVHDYDSCTLQWRFEMPPLLEPMRVKPVSNGIPKWVTADAQLPDGAIIGGFEKEILYIIRAKHQGSLTPGKFVPSQGVGYIPWGGGMQEHSELEVLCGFDCMWVPCCNGRVPAGSVEAGHSEVDHEPLYVGRALYYDNVIPGKIQPSHDVCYIPYGEREIAIKKYEVLVIPHKNVQCANQFFVLNHARRIM